VSYDGRQEYPTDTVQDDGSMAESTTLNLNAQPATSTSGDAAASSDPPPPVSLEPSNAAAAGNDDRPSTSTFNHDQDRDDPSSPLSPLPLSAVIAPEAAAKSVVVALHRIASTTIPAAAVPVAAGSGAGVRARATSIAVPRRSSTATVVLNVARSLRQQVVGFTVSSAPRQS